MLKIQDDTAIGEKQFIENTKVNFHHNIQFYGVLFSRATYI